MTSELMNGSKYCKFKFMFYIGRNIRQLGTLYDVSNLPSSADELAKSKHGEAELRVAGDNSFHEATFSKERTG